MSSRGFWTQKKLKKLKEHIRFSQIIEKNSMLPPKVDPKPQKCTGSGHIFIFLLINAAFTRLKFMPDLQN